MNKTKIEWCDYTWNPVWGCKNNCEYCYARSIAKRFSSCMADKEVKAVSPERMKLGDPGVHREHLAWCLDRFIPVWLESNYSKPFPTKSKKIFVNSMSDISYWEKEWLRKVLSEIRKQKTQHFLFLTKDPSVYLTRKFPVNAWLGTTITNPFDLHRRNILSKSKADNKRFLSIEPIMKPIVSLLALDDYHWVIIGSETGNRKDKVVPDFSWLELVANYCREHDIPLFMKDSLQSIWPGALVQEFPEELR